MTITFASVLFLFFFIFKGLQKNVFFVLYVCSMVSVAYFLEYYQGWNVKLFSKQCLLLFILFHFPLINFFTFLAYGRDKKLATRKEWRIPEIQLHTLEFLGGNIGAVLAQKFFHHKYKKKSYMTTFWIICLLQIGAVYYILVYFKIL